VDEQQPQPLALLAIWRSKEAFWVQQIRRARPRAGRALAIVLFSATVSVALLFNHGAGAGATGSVRRAEASPATNLGDQVVAVSWQGFRPTRPDGTFGVTILQCRQHPKSVDNDCNTATFPLSFYGNQAQGVTQPNGTGAAFIDIESTARLPSLACSHANPCSLLLYEVTPNGFDPAHMPPVYALVDLSFRANAADCPPPTRFDVRFESESSAAAALYQWAADFCTAKPPLSLDVTNTSSTAARRQFFQGNVDVGVSSLPPQPGEAPKNAPSFAVAPLDLTAVVLAYNIADPVTGQRITDLTLTPRLIARIISDSDILTLFQDPEFKKLNPHHTFPRSVAEPLLRAEQNADTWLVTNWINNDSEARAFLDGHDKYGISVNDAWRGVKYPTDVFEARSPTGAYLPRTGEEAAADRLFHADTAQDILASPTDFGFFSVLDLPTARRFALPIANLTTGVGKPVVSLSDASIKAAESAMTTTPDGFHLMPGAPSGTDQWPLTKVDHAMVPTKAPPDNPDLLKHVHAFLDYAVGPGQKTLPPGFVTLPAALAAQALKTADALTPTTTTTNGSSSTPSPANAADHAFASGEPIASPGDSSATAANPPSGGTDATASGAAAAAHETRAPKGASRPHTAQPIFALASANPERLALPILLLLGLLAFALTCADSVRRRGPSVVASARRRVGKSPPPGKPQ
jgi:ABC-type phosphate transport system substrate-binding protein